MKKKLSISAKRIAEMKGEFISSENETQHSFGATRATLAASNFSVRRVFPFFVFLLCASAHAQPQPRVINFSQPDDSKIAVPYAAPGGVTSGATVAIEDGVLTFRNRAPGSFGVQLNLTPLDLDQVTDLEFDFKTSPDTRVNWFFRVDKNYYGVHFTGPQGVRPGATLLGEVEITDGANGWKHAHIPLRGWLRALLPDQKSVVLGEILIGNWDNEGYLMAGIGGNGPGAWWQMDNLKLEKRDETAQFGPARFENGDLVIPARDLASFDFKDLQLSLDATHEITDAARFFVPQRGLVVPVVEWGATTLRDGQQIDWQLKRGAPGSVVAQGKTRFAFADLKHPELPTLQWADTKLTGDMERPVITGWDSSDAAIELDSTTAASGAQSLRFTNRRTASPFAISTPAKTLDAARFPVLTFSYRADDRLRTDLNFKWDGKPYSIQFTDRDNPNPRVASIAGVRADNQWHVATVNLLESLRKVRPDATNFNVTNLEFADTKWLGNAKGVQWWLDDWRPAPLVAGELNARVLGRDLSGVKGVSWILDQKADTQPAEKSNGDTDLKIDLTGKTGLWWLHVRTQNGAGKWSETAHFPFCS